jgi:DNA-binding GntR family transcriptional regulator
VKQSSAKLAFVSPHHQIVRETRGKPRFDALYGALRERIVLLDLPPGADLKESRLAEEFGVSRTPIRRAIQALEVDGLVETKAGIGTFVTSFDLSSMKDSYALRMRLSELLGDFPPNYPVSSLSSEAEELLNRAKALTDNSDFRCLLKINNSLQDLSGRCTGNLELRSISERLYYRTIRIYYEMVKNGHLSWDDEVVVTIEEVSDILKAVRANDGRGVGFVRRNNMWLAVNRISSFLLVR